MIGLWDTTGIEVVKALSAERRSSGGLTSGLALTLVAVVDERRVREAEAAATIAASQHPCRLIIVVRQDSGTATRSRLDAEIVVGGRLGPCEAVVLRTQGRLALLHPPHLEVELDHGGDDRVAHAVARRLRGDQCPKSPDPDEDHPRLLRQAGPGRQSQVPPCRDRDEQVNFGVPRLQLTCVAARAFRGRGK